MSSMIKLAVLSLLLSGCTSVETLRPDMEARPFPSRLDEIAFINGLKEAYVTVQSTDGCYVGEKLRQFRPKFAQGYLDYDDAAQVNLRCIAFDPMEGVPESEKEARIRRYLENGFGLTDIYCQRYFIVASQSRQARRMQRDTGSSVDVLMSGILTALGAGTSGLAVLNSGFEAYDSTYKNIDNAFLVAPDRDDVRKLVHAAQEKLRADAFKGDLKPQSYPAGRAFIERYAGMCSFDAMRRLVSDAVEIKAAELKKDADNVGKKPPVGPVAATSGTPATVSPPAPGAVTNASDVTVMSPTTR